MRYLLTLLLCIPMFSNAISLTYPYIYQATVLETRDGDTYRVSITDHQGTHEEWLRIANVQCAESGTVRGDAITRALDKALTGKTLTVRTYGRGYYKRILADFMFGDTSLSKILLDYNICPAYKYNSN